MKLAVVGAGYWGPNLVRSLLGMRIEEVVVCDKDEARLDLHLNGAQRARQSPRGDRLAPRGDPAPSRRALPRAPGASPRLNPGRDPRCR